MRLILASKSLRRIEILKKYGYKFDVIPSNIQEKTKYKRPHLVVMDLAQKKANDIANKNPDAIIIGADTIVYCQGKIIGKPKDKNDAKKLLRWQSGKWQSVYTGIAVICIKKNIKITDYEKSSCYMRKLSDEEIEEISIKHLDKAGGWGVQDKNDKLITKIKGSYYNIVGLPIEKLNKILKRIL